ncbi:MAG: 30S ribosomal protein S20 [Ignavibacteria bacterium GWF2_33_9]|nr:MAG: 30S ribosomal protein S20 [Ignavibacteria bacterium GWF2_33_9]
MAHHKSALKRIRQSRKARIYNRQNKKVLKFALRSVKEATTFEDAVAKYQKATSVLDRVAAKGIIHKNNAAHQKSALAKFVKKLDPSLN